MYYTPEPQQKKPGFHVPVNLDPNLIPRGRRQAAAYFLNLLHWRWVCWQADVDGFVRLKQEYITKIIGAEVWPEIRVRLCKCGVIGWGNTWVPSKRCQSYCLMPDYRKSKRIPCTDEALARRIRKVFAKERGPDLPVHRWLAEKLDLLEFDLERAGRIVAGMKPDEGSKMTVPEYREQLTETCKRIAAGDHWLVCDAYGRVHTPMTSLAKELRPCLRVQGQPLVGLDLANSQPLIAGICARQFYRSRGARHRLCVRRFDLHANPYRYRELRQIRGKLETTPPGVEQYVKVCEEGRLYESMMKPGEQRGKFKRQFLTMMYGRNDRWGSRLKTAHPSIADMLHKIKRRDYRHAAHVMQNLEASIFIHVICNRIRLERSELPIYTIHDSVFTLPGAVGYVESVILDEFDKLGIRPTLKQEKNE